jgi:hypothetical protein
VFAVAVDRPDSRGLLSVNGPQTNVLLNG